MLKTYAAVLLATMLIASPAFAHPGPTGPIYDHQGHVSSSNPSATGGGSSGYNESLRRDQ
jgi:hypothetical protein